MKAIIIITFLIWILFCQGCATKGYRWVAVGSTKSNWYQNPNERRAELERYGVPSEQHSKMLLHTKQITIQKYNEYKFSRRHGIGRNMHLMPHTESREAGSFMQLLGMGLLDNGVK